MIPRQSSPLVVPRVSLGHGLLLEWGLPGWGEGEMQVGRGADEEVDSCSSGLTSLSSGTTPLPPVVIPGRRFHPSR